MTYKLFKMTCCIVAALLASVYLSVFAYAQELEQTGKEHLKREFRGAWFPTVTNRTWKNMTTDQVKADIIKTLDSFAVIHINAVLFQVRPQADALFVSEYEPWSRFITGEQGKAPEPFWDPAAFVIEECHKRGMEMHAWFNPYRVTSNDKEVLAPDHLYYKKPYLFVKYGTQLYFDPGEPQAREHTARVIADFVRRYDVDAVHFDDYFYPYRIGREEFPDEISFIKYHKKDGFGRWDKLNWRRNNVNVLVEMLNDTIKNIKPWVKFGISPFGVWRNFSEDLLGSDSKALQTNYDDLFADIRLWCINGWIDYNVPQLYWAIGHPLANYQPLIKWWSQNKFNAQLYIGQSISSLLEAKLPGGATENQLYKKMALLRECGNIEGNVWWSGTGLVHNEKLMDSLKNNYQKYPAFMPLYKNLDSIPPAPVVGLKLKGETLSWRAVPSSDPMNEAVYFAVYRFKEGDPINLDDATKLLAIVRDPSYCIPYAILHSGHGKRHYYVVTAIDRLWNESKPVKIKGK